jgi:hypothetical protein
MQEQGGSGVDDADTQVEFNDFETQVVVTDHEDKVGLANALIGERAHKGFIKTAYKSQIKQESTKKLVEDQLESNLHGKSPATAELIRRSPRKTPRLEHRASASPNSCAQAINDLPATDLTMSSDGEEPGSKPEGKKPDLSTSNKNIWDPSTSTLPHHTYRTGPPNLGVIEDAHDLAAPSAVMLELMMFRVDLVGGLDDNVEHFVQQVFCKMAEQTKALERRLKNYKNKTGQQFAVEGTEGSMRPKTPLAYIRE